MIRPIECKNYAKMVYDRGEETVIAELTRLQTIIVRAQQAMATGDAVKTLNILHSTNRYQP